MSYIVFNQMLIIFLLIGIGAFLYKKSIITDDTNKFLSNMVLTVFNPALIISGSLAKKSVGGIKEVILAIVIASATFAALIILGKIIPHVLKIKSNERSIYSLMTIFGNVGFIGIPMVAAVFGNSAIIFVTMFNLPYNLLIYTYGIYLVTKDSSQNVKYKISDMWNAGTISSLIALLLFGMKIQLPDFITNTINTLGNATTSLSMITIGVSLAQISIKDIFTSKKLYIFNFIRLLIIPICACLILKHVITNELIYGVTILTLAMPIGSMSVILAQKYGVDSTLASRGVVLSTGLSLVTIPLVALFM